MIGLPGCAPVVTAQAMRAAEAAAFASGVTQDDLMERAGRAVAKAVRRVAAGRQILVLAGPGNNGGDAYAAARMLGDWGHDVVVAANGKPRPGAAARMAARWRGDTVELAAAAPRPVLVDGLFGTGVIRRLGSAICDALARLLASAETIVAIDLPSGCEADRGDPLGSPMTAQVTVALGALKRSHVLMPSRERCGHVLLETLGLEVESGCRIMGPPRLSIPPTDATKFSRGMVVIVGGAMPGAAHLAAGAAAHGGAGYVVLAERERSPGGPQAVVRRSVDELAALLYDPRIDVVVIGPGLGRDETARESLDVVLASPHDLVIDGDALSLLGRDVARRIAGSERTVILTPHAGEFARMFDEDGDKITATLRAAAEAQAIVVHKGTDTVIGFPDGRAQIASGATAWLATAGTGDVLAGLVAARHAGGGEDAAAAAVWLHARAARLAGPAFVANALIDRLPAAIAESLWR